METNTIRREIKKIDLQSVLNSIVELFQLEIKNKEIEVTAHYKLCPSINADIDEITRLFTNLISNAIKYNRITGRINIGLSQSGNYNLIEIKDTGIGMKPAERKKLFQEFFRAKNELTQNICGTGLGLSIVKRIVDSYAGKIEVESEYNAGSVFRVYLPYQ